MATRRRAREVTLQMLFQFESLEISPEESILLYRESFGEGNLHLATVPPDEGNGKAQRVL